MFNAYLVLTNGRRLERDIGSVVHYSTLPVRLPVAYIGEKVAFRVAKSKTLGLARLAFYVSKAKKVNPKTK